MGNLFKIMGNIFKKSHENRVYKPSTIAKPGLFRRGVRSHTHVPTHVQKCLDV